MTLSPLKACSARREPATFSGRSPSPLKDVADGDGGLAGLFDSGIRRGETVSEEGRKGQVMHQRITKNTIMESTTGQLTEMYYELVRATSLRAAQGMGTDEMLNETVAEVVAEMNARTSGAQDSQLPPAA